MRTRRNNTIHGKIRYPIGYNYKPTPIFLNEDPDMPKTWWGWVLAFIVAAVFVILPNLI